MRPFRKMAAMKARTIHTLFEKLMNIGPAYVHPVLACQNSALISLIRR